MKLSLVDKKFYLKKIRSLAAGIESAKEIYLLRKVGAGRNDENVAKAKKFLEREAFLRIALLPDKREYGWGDFGPELISPILSFYLIIDSAGNYYVLMSHLPMDGEVGTKEKLLVNKKVSRFLFKLIFLNATRLDGKPYDW